MSIIWAGEYTAGLGMWLWRGFLAGVLVGWFYGDANQTQIGGEYVCDDGGGGCEYYE